RNGGSIALEPRYCRVAHSIAPADIGKGFPIGSPCQRLCDLELGELRLSTEPHPTIHRSFTSIRGSSKDHRSLKLRQGSKHGQDQPTLRASGVDHWVSKGSEASTLLRYACQDIEEVPGASRQSVKPSH